MMLWNPRGVPVRLPALPAPLRHRLSVASRVLAAVFGGYALAAAVTVFLSFALARAGILARADAVLTATLTSFAVCAGAALWVFAAPTAGRAWAGIAVPAVVLGAMAWLLRSGAAP